MCADVNEYEELAGEIRRLFERRFGELSQVDFRKVARVLGFEVLHFGARPTREELYERLSEQERADVDFMMGL